MKMHSGLTANMALMLALWSVTITASPIMSVVDRLANHEAPGAPVVAAFMRELELERANQQVWETEYQAAINTYKTSADYLNNIVLATEKDQNVKDELVCVNHQSLIDFLTNTVESKWKQADAAWTAKSTLLAEIRKLLNDKDQGLHCGDNPSKAAKALCDLLTELEKTAQKERATLNGHKTEIDAHKMAINDYSCDCTFTAWSEFSECDGGDVRTVTTYSGCTATQTEAECAINENAKCGTGETFKTRTFKWFEKNGGVACPQTGDGVTVDGDVGTLSADHIQRFTKICKAGEHDGNCPVHCEWNEWTEDLDDVVCKDDDHKKLVECTAEDGELAEGKRSRTRTYKTEPAKFGGKPCFYKAGLLENGQKEEEVCHYHDNAIIDQNAEKAQMSKKDNTISALKAEMCKGESKLGPCKNGASCDVTLVEGKVTSWCKCPDTHTGPWCEEKIEIVWQETQKIWTSNQCYQLKVRYLGGSGSALEDCKQICLEEPNCSAINFKDTSGICVLRACGPAPIPQPESMYPPWKGYTSNELKQN